MSSELARHLDLMTGTYVRPYFEGELARAVARCTRKRHPLSLLYVDLDELQELNDLHGRDAADAAISGLAQTVSDALEGRHPIGRVEGGAYAVLLEGVTLEEARRLAERVRRSTRMGRTGFTFTVSVGVASLRTGEPSGNLLEAAEAACVKAKQAGRNGVVAR
jgi:diguanylate cyclase (GGDEF)-like protein